MKILKKLKLQDEVDCDENNIYDEIQTLEQVKRENFVFSFFLYKNRILFIITSSFSNL